MASAEDDAPVTRTFDFRFLLRQESPMSLPDMSCPAEGAPASDAEEPGFPGVLPFGAEALPPLLQEALPTIDWNSPETSMSFNEGMLTVHAPKAAMDRVAAAVDFLHRSFARRVTVDVEVYRFEPGVLNSLDAGVGTLGADVEGKVREAAADPKRGTTLAVLRVATCDGRRARASSGHDRTFVMGYGAFIATKASILEPQVRTHRLGAILDVVPVLGCEGEPLLLDFRLAFAQPGVESKFEGGAAGEGPVQQPGREIWAWEAATRVPPGRMALLFAGSAEGLSGGGDVAVLARASVAEPAGDFPSGPEDSVVRVLDAGPSMADISDRPAFPLGLPQVDEQPGLPGAGSNPDEAPGHGIQEDQLLPILQERFPQAANGNGDAILRVSAGKAWLRGVPSEMEAVAQRLRELSAARRAVGVEAIVIALPESEWLRRRSALQDPGAGANLVARALRGEGIRVAAGLRACGMAGQLFEAAAFEERLIVRSRTVEIAESQVTGTPVVAPLRQGFRFRVRVLPGADPARLSLSYQGQLVWGAEITPIETGSPAGRAQCASPRIFESAGDTTVAAGKWSIAGVDLGEAPGGGREARVMLFRISEAR
jgi:hypothetical protein